MLTEGLCIKLIKRFYHVAPSAFSFDVIMITLPLQRTVCSSTPEMYQILNGVVKCISVNMVNSFTFDEGPSDMLLHNISVFVDVFTIHPDVVIPARTKTLAEETSHARPGTETFSSEARSSIKRLAAYFTGFGDASSFSHIPSIA